MPRPRTLPRSKIDGVYCLELYDEDLFRQLDLESVPTKEMLTAIVERLEYNVQTAERFFIMRSETELFKKEEDGTVVWGVRDTPFNSAQYRVLSKRLINYIEEAIKATNSYTKELVENYDE